MKYRITKNGSFINIIESSLSFVESYCSINGYNYELIEVEENQENQDLPSEMDRLESQVMYTAMMTDTLIESE